MRVDEMKAERERKEHSALRQQKPFRFNRDGEVRKVKAGGWGGGGRRGRGGEVFRSNAYSLHCHHQNDPAVRWDSCMSHFNVLLFFRPKSQDSVHKPQFFNGKEKGRRFEFEADSNGRLSV